MSQQRQIPLITPRDGIGHQFVCYADSCSGKPGELHETTFESVNAVITKLDSPPQFICFPGNEISGLTADSEGLRSQWTHWHRQLRIYAGHQMLNQGKLAVVPDREGLW